MGTYDYDLLVMGAGSGGLATAKRAASYGAKVGIVEGDRVGGTCVIRGCIPKKLMVYAGEAGHAAHDATGYGWTVDLGKHDWAHLVEVRNREVARLENLHERFLGEASVELVRGDARISGPHSLQVGGKELTAERILIATGATPVLPDIPGVEHAITSDGFFELAERPSRVVVVGSGYIGCEFACFLSALECEVTLLVRRDLPLTGFDADMQAGLLAAMQEDGIDVRLGTSVREIERKDGATTVHVDGPDGPSSIVADSALVYAVGRKPNSAGLGFEEVGLALGRKGEVLCGEDGTTAVESILAVGDVTGRAALTPVAIQAGRAIADRVWGGKETSMSYENIPSAVFTSPPIGSVGLTEAQANEKFGSDAVKVYRSSFVPLIYTLTERKVRTIVKLVVTGAEEKVVGCHILGHDGPEIIQGFAVAVKMGATKADFDATVGIHPSTAEEFVTM